MSQQHKIIFVIVSMGVIFITCKQPVKKLPVSEDPPPGRTVLDSAVPVSTLSSDSLLYQKLMRHILQHASSAKWPAMNEKPLPGAILPYKRIVAYYGNFYAPQMGVLGALLPDKMLQQLLQEVVRWEKADTLLPVQPALHYIAVTAQRNPGPSGKYRLQMPFQQIDTTLALARSIKAITFLDVQVGLSNLQAEVPLLKKYLIQPDVHLGIDPEYSMKNKQPPCTTIGTFDAADINYVITYLADLVQKYQLPPKVLIIHRFTQAMVTNYQEIKRVPEVQVVINMDGFGSPAKKINTYNHFIAAQPVQFTGFKLFYKNDMEAGGQLMKPSAILQLNPQPIYIQYQ